MCMRKENYLKVKHYIKSLCLDNVIELCHKTGLTEEETELVKHVCRGDSRVFISLKMGMCESAVSKNTHKTFSKIQDYLKRNNIQY